MKNLLLLMTLLILFASSSCDPPLGAEVVYSIWLKNNSGQGIAFIVNYTYPDTLLPQDYNRLQGVPAGERVPYDSQKKWEKVFDEDLPQDTLSIFIFTDIITPENWEQTRSSYNVAKRYDLSLQDLKRLNWTVTYPPTPEMADIKMYPK